MTTDPSFYLRGAGKPSMDGASGYFSAPGQSLDPHLFSDTEQIRPEVRRFILNTLYEQLRSWGWQKVNDWLAVWIAGSGITYQWRASRGNGDLDVLFGVDYTKFTTTNPSWAGQYTEHDLSAEVNDGLRNSLWPKTQAKEFNGQKYEVTFYWNPGVGKDLTVIHPYAAYNLTLDQWDVRPPELPPDPHKLYPRPWYEAAERDTDTASRLTGEYSQQLDALRREPEGSPRWHNASSALNLAVSQASALLEDIHTGRRAAFQQDGGGYGDWNNFRWQRAKETGVIASMHSIAKAGEEATEADQVRLYGQPILPAERAIRQAIAVHRPWRR